MCNGCENPSIVWGVDAAGAEVAREVERLLARTLPHRHPALDDIEDWVHILPGASAEVPGHVGFGLAVYIGADASLLLATRRSVPYGRWRTAIAAYVGSADQAPATDGFLLVVGLDVERAATVIAALVEATLLGPTTPVPIEWPEGTPDETVKHVISSFVAHGTFQEIFMAGRATCWGFGRARGPLAGRDATIEAMSDAQGSRSENASPERMIVAHIGGAVSGPDARLAIAGCLPRSADWRVAVFRADGLEPDEVEVVMLGGEGAVLDEREWRSSEAIAAAPSRTGDGS